MNETSEALSLATVCKASPVRAEAKAEWVRRFKESGLSIRKFSAQHELPRMSLWRWVNQASPKAVEQANCPAPVFTEIKWLPPVERSDWAAELSLPNGRVLRLSKEVPASLLEQLLRLC